jgi:hypothetical protein
VVGAIPGEVAVLDFEPFGQTSPAASWPQYVIDFADAVLKATGREAWLYSEDYHLGVLEQQATPAQLARIRRMPLWKAGNGNAYVASPDAAQGDLHGWPALTCWQWTSTPLDRDVFYGTAADWRGDPIPTPAPEEPPVAAIYWRGVRVCACMSAPLNEAARLITVRTKAAGVADWYLTPIQGSYSTSTAASGGTHDGGGAIDLKMGNLGAKQKVILESVMREVGHAGWNREPSWWSSWYGKIIYGGWSSHHHAIRTGCPHLSTAAKAQVAEYVRGENGLVGGDKDTGTRAFVGRTWEAYLAIKNAVVGIGGAVVDAERIKGIQRSLRLTVDGKLGPQTYAAVWRLSKASRDGRKGFLSMSLTDRKALQKNIGCKFVDGGWIWAGSEMPKRLSDAMGGWQSAMGLPIDRVWTDAVEGKQFGALMARVGYKP